ncbi:MAG: hypothetical protein ACM3JP_02855 [Betaproteobacteria bacterium]
MQPPIHVASRWCGIRTTVNEVDSHSGNGAVIQFAVRARLEVRDGKLEGFERQAAELTLPVATEHRRIRSEDETERGPRTLSMPMIRLSSAAAPRPAGLIQPSQDRDRAGREGASRGVISVNDHHPEQESAGPPAVPAGPGSAVSRPGWTGGRVTALVLGALLVLIGLGLAGGGGTALWFDRTQRDSAGYITTGVHEFSASSPALATERIHLGSAGTGWPYAPAPLDRVRIRVTPVSPGPPLFVGIGPSADVDRYLAGAKHTVISDFWGNRVQTVEGGTPTSAPGTQTFWVASSTGTGARTVEWTPANGSWTVVVMNADARPGIDVKADLGARAPALLWFGVGFLVAGVLFVVGGVFLIAGAVRRASRTRTT